MTDEPIHGQVERALAALTSTNRQITFTAVAAATGISRTTLYRNAQLRALVEEHRNHASNARTLTSVATEIAHLTDTLNALATRVRQHEERLRRLEKRPTSITN
ncbi:MULTISPECIES: DUF6262 family protein [unclassified Pseudofrankia]|uniref:DUF6262 family protein n=1 Tax=unclassified Pseudofrankia TaxID=2994372 RepID=UPI0008D9E5DC|nr:MULTISPECIES: DUF6262 family protein [unclassified Pseudofrankia]MDT3445115.1 DUF6262 family protein [Pseudofrankia sp. BMG5.37]OHV47345.1 hypothetical protein BCD48_18425 [Pseudofrankia sp. BMG5.36]